MTTYSQVNKEDRIQRPQLYNFTKGQILLLDESHLASGEDSNTGDYMRGILPAAKGVIYSSATYAKRLSSMLIYSRNTET